MLNATLVLELRPCASWSFLTSLKSNYLIHPLRPCSSWMVMNSYRDRRHLNHSLTGEGEWIGDHFPLLKDHVHYLVFGSHLLLWEDHTLGSFLSWLMHFMQLNFLTYAYGMMNKSLISYRLSFRNFIHTLVVSRGLTTQWSLMSKNLGS